MDQINFCLKYNTWIKGKNISNPPPVKFRCKIKSVWSFLHRHCIDSRHNLPSSIILYDLLQCLVYYSFSYSFKVPAFKTTNCDECIDRKRGALTSASKLVQTCFNVSSDKWRAIIKLHCMQSSWSFKQDRPSKQGWSWKPSTFLVQQFSLIAYHQQIVDDNNWNLMVL